MSEIKNTHGGARVGAGRPPFKEGELKDTSIFFKCSQAEKDKLKENAKKSGLSVSAYILSRCL